MYPEYIEVAQTRPEFEVLKKWRKHCETRMCLKQLPDTIQGANVRTPVHHSCEQFCSHQRRHGPHAATHEIRVWKVGQTSDGHYACRRPYYVNYMHFPKYLASVSGTTSGPEFCVRFTQQTCVQKSTTDMGRIAIREHARHKPYTTSKHARPIWDTLPAAPGAP